jgi:hypothetical protein
MGRFILNPEFLDGKLALGFLGEVGKGNARANGTLGFSIAPGHNIKVGGEYLTQKLRYRFYDGSTQRWMQQWAIGGKYQAPINGCFLKGVILDGYYSNAPSKNLNTHQLSNTQLLYRKITGSLAYGFEGGIVCTPLNNTIITLLIDYDNVQYKNKFCRNKHQNGFGQTVKINQRLFSDLALNLLAEFRKPYNNYSAELLYSFNTKGNGASAGIFGGYTQGKSGLPSVATAGIQVGFSFGETAQTRSAYYSSDCCEASCSSELAAWVLEPAVYRPMVLAINEQKFVATCTPPQALTPAPDVVFLGTNFVSFNAAPYFTGDNLTWSATIDGPPVSSVTIDSSGFVTINLTPTQDADLFITVTATNSCGTAVGIFETIIQTE